MGTSTRSFGWKNPATGLVYDGRDRMMIAFVNDEDDVRLASANEKDGPPSVCPPSSDADAAATTLQYTSDKETTSRPLSYMILKVSRQSSCDNLESEG